METSTQTVGRGRGRGRLIIPNESPYNQPQAKPGARELENETSPALGGGRANPGNVLQENRGKGRGRRVSSEAASMCKQGQATSATSSQGVTAVPSDEATTSGRSRAVARRARRNVEEIVHSRPENCVTKRGTSGVTVTMETNYFKVLKKPTWTIYQYRVDFSPDVEMPHMRRAYLYHHKELFGGYVFDGAVMFSTQHIVPQSRNGLLELLTKNKEGDTIQMKIKLVGLIDRWDIQLLQVLNLILRRSLEGLNLQRVGRNFYDAAAKAKLHDFRLEIWPGYETSIRQHEEDILLCAEIAHKVMRTESLHHILLECSCTVSDDFQAAFKQQVIGMIVLTAYNNKTYRIDDVDFKMNPMSAFSTKEGDKTFVEYYKQRYNIDIHDRRQPLLLSHPKEKALRDGKHELILLVPELCLATGMTNGMRSDFRLMKAMSDHTRLPPQRRIERLKMFNSRLHSSSDSIRAFQEWHLKLDVNLVTVEARILPSQDIFFGGRQKYTTENGDWTNQLLRSAQFVTVHIKRWIVIAPRHNLRDISHFVQCCIQTARNMKMQIAEPKYIEMNDDRNSSYCTAIERAATQDPQMVMCLLVNTNSEKYGLIKKKCCIDRPLPSQVVTMRAISPQNIRKLPAVATKVVIQMNAKIFGAPWMIDVPVEGIMVAGFDVSHSPKSRNMSYGALVASMDMKFSTKYYSAITEHMKGQELSKDIGMHMKCAVHMYQKEHNKLPERIFFYRDGVGDGQLQQVVNTEMHVLRSALDELYKQAGHANGCRLVFFVVSKRIRSRIFYKGENPPPGTVVDSGITLPERYDFFLVSQSVRQGTVSPTSYNIISDNSGWKANNLQILTYRYTHMYFNWSGTCRVPAVCQYAHKLAFLVAEHLQRAPHRALANQLYFL